MFSLEPDELAELVRAVREAWDALGNADLLSGRVRPGAEHARSLFVMKDIRRGERFEPDHVRAIRPGLGLPPRSLGKVIGRHAKRDLARGEALAWEDID